MQPTQNLNSSEIKKVRNRQMQETDDGPVLLIVRATQESRYKSVSQVKEPMHKRKNNKFLHQ
jgi:hypothetical protein